MNLHSAIPVLTVMNFHHGLLEKGTTSEMKRILLGALLLSGLMLAVAQVKKEDLATKNTKSPGAETSVTVNGKNIWIYYHAPSVRGRRVPHPCAVFCARMGFHSRCRVGIFSIRMKENQEAPRLSLCFLPHVSPKHIQPSRWRATSQKA
jgi:hypothetical protein